MSNSLEPYLHEILAEGVDDWIPVDRLIGLARTVSKGQDDELRAEAKRLIEHIIINGLMIPGSIGENGFEPWHGTPERLAERVIRECDYLAWDPRGAGCWMANTEKGDRLAGS